METVNQSSIMDNLELIIRYVVCNGQLLGAKIGAQKIRDQILSI